nr:unnamed protein product [Callosobruchus chinensis]
MSIKFCGAFELALWAHDETTTSDNPGIYVGLVNFTAEIDALLAMHMKGSQVFKGISHYSERVIRCIVGHLQAGNTKRNEMCKFSCVGGR